MTGEPVALAQQRRPHLQDRLRPGGRFQNFSGPLTRALNSSTRLPVIGRPARRQVVAGLRTGAAIPPVERSLHARAAEALAAAAPGKTPRPIPAA